MVKSIEEFRNEAMFKQGLRRKPFETLKSIYQKTSEEDIQKAIDKVLPKILRDMTIGLIKSREFNEFIISSVLNEIPRPKDGIDGVDGKDGKDGINGKDGRDGKDGKDAELDYDLLAMQIFAA